MTQQILYPIAYIQYVLSRKEVIYAPFTIYTKLPSLKSETETIRLSYSPKTFSVL